MEVLVGLVMLLHVSQHAFGVEVNEGDDSVTLPCKVDASLSKDSTVFWKREEFVKPIVHSLKPSGDDLGSQNQLYTNRTEMSSDALITGNLNLTLTKPNTCYSGTYVCSVRRAGKDLDRTEVRLVVKERPAPTTPTPTTPAPTTPASRAGGPHSTVCLWLLVGVFAAVAAAAAVAAVIMYCAYIRERNRPEYQVETVEWTEGMKSVLLPFKIMTDLSKDICVEWRQLFPRNNLVLGYQVDSNSTGKVCGAFIGRTDMKEDLLRSGDLSLTLKNPSSDDCGLYICTVLKDGQILRQKAVDLTGVTGFQVGTVEVTEGEKSVLLPFTTTPNPTVNVTVKWLNCDKLVHVYPNEQNQPNEEQGVFRGRTKMQENPLTTGDLSLTLCDPSCDNRGFYICILYRDGKVLKQKVVALSVRETLMGTVKGVFHRCTKKRRNSTDPADDKTDLLADNEV